MKYYLWALIWALFVLVIISAPIDTEGTPSFPGIDKLVHTGIFFVFTVLLLYGNIRNKAHPSFLSISTGVSFIIASGFAFLTEIIQKCIFTYRSFEWWDLFADHVGIGMGLFAYLIFVIGLNLASDRKAIP